MSCNDEEEEASVRVVDELGRALEPDEIRLIVAGIVADQLPKIVRTTLRTALLRARGRVD
jgi:hypothetical protein